MVLKLLFMDTMTLQIKIIVVGWHFNAYNTFGKKLNFSGPKYQITVFLGQLPWCNILHKEVKMSICNSVLVYLGNLYFLVISRYKFI